MEIRLYLLGFNTESTITRYMYIEAFLMTGKLIVWCFFMGILFGVPLGIIGAIKRNIAIGQGLIDSRIQTEEA